jgi:hypothetical protein
MRLFRQPHAGAWEPVVREIVDAVAATVRERTQERLRPEKGWVTNELTL